MRVRLETERLLLRNMVPEDAEAAMRWCGDPAVNTYMIYPLYHRVEDLRTWLEGLNPDDPDDYDLGICLRETGELIGSGGLTYHPERGAWEIGYNLRADQWGHGYTVEMLRGLMELISRTRPIAAIDGVFAAENDRSRRVMEKMGMRWVRDTAYEKTDGSRCYQARYYRRDFTPPLGAPAPRPGETAVRFAREEDLPAVNVLRRQVNDLHVAGKPEVFKPGFCRELQDYVFAIWEDPAKRILVAERDGEVCGFAVLNHISRPENPFMYARDFLDVDEFGVDENHRRQGIATALMAFIRNWAKEAGFQRLELNMWEFNQGALAFYEEAGFTTFRRYMEIRL